MHSVHAQFVNVSNDLLLSTDHTGGYLGSGVSFADFNGDEIDDLTFGHHAGQIRYYQGDGVGFEEVQLNIENGLYETKSVLWADIDNDGDQD
ncbi:MAG: VCBS repeat-containing protein, partial [Flavobacteriales bacterium]